MLAVLGVRVTILVAVYVPADVLCLSLGLALLLVTIFPQFYRVLEVQEKNRYKFLYLHGFLVRV